jgi:hypothetical protein
VANGSIAIGSLEGESVSIAFCVIANCGEQA